MEKTMLAAIFQGPQKPLKLEERPVPTIEKDNDVILQVGGVGICGSDVSMLTDFKKHPALPGVIFGHEFCGKIVALGEGVKKLKIGQKVAVDQNPGCGHCDMCRNGFPNACINLFDNPLAPEYGWPYTPGQWWDGGLARYVKIPEHYCYEINQDVPMKHVAVFEPLGVVVNALSKVKPQVGEYAVVIGGGAVGLFATSLIKAAGAAKIIACEISPKRKELLKKCGADIIVDPTKEDLATIVKQNTKGYGAQVVVEAVGTQLPTALDCICYGGRIAQIGIPSKDISFRPFQIYAKEAEIYGSFLMKYATNPTIRILENNLVPMDTIITHTFPLEKVNEGIEIAKKGEGGKVVILPNEI
jgi:threonine 3-dehydrogenase